MKVMLLWPHLRHLSIMVEPCQLVSFAGVYRFSLTLGSLSANDSVCVSVLLVVWWEASTLGSAGNWEELGLRFRFKHSWGLSSNNIHWSQEFSGGP